MAIKNHLAAGYPILAVETFDDSRLFAELAAAGRSALTFSAAMVLVDENGTRETMNWQVAFTTTAAREHVGLIVRDANHVIANPPIYRALLDCCALLAANGSTVILVAPNFGTLPPELVHVAPLIRQPLPTREELAEPLQTVATAANVELNGNRSALLDAAAGLTLAEAENAFALALVESGELEPATVQREKMRTLAGTGYLTVEQPRELASVGGLGAFKAYLAGEVIPNCRDIDLQVRGVLLAGLPGTGKSQLAKAAAAALRWPLIRLDVGACKGGLVGQSESNIRNATAVIEAVAPCVLWIDEIEKAVGGFKSSAATDGGTTLGMVGHLLTWLQEHRQPIFTVATCNDYNALPPELTRAGRFDERWVVDLPTVDERKAIAVVHLNRLDCSTELAETIAQRTDGFTGAEIEQLVKSAARLSGRRPALADIAAASASIKPLSVINRDAVVQFRNWSKKALRLANDAEPVATGPARRVSVN